MSVPCTGRWHRAAARTRGALAASLGFLLFWRQAGGPPWLSRAALRAPFPTGCVDGMGRWGHCPLTVTPELCLSWGAPAKCRVEPAEPAPAPRRLWRGGQRSDSIWLGARCSCRPDLGGPPADRGWTDPGAPLRGPVWVHLGQFGGREVTGGGGSPEGLAVVGRSPKLLDSRRSSPQPRHCARSDGRGMRGLGCSTLLQGSWTLCRQEMRPQTTRELPAGRPSHTCPSEAWAAQ